MRRVQHERDVDFVNKQHHDTKCVVCKKDIRLYFNGGELDQARCCGHLYRLESAQVDFYIYKE